MAFPGAVRKGGLLRGKVPQGETSLPKPGVKELRYGPEKKKNVSNDVKALRFFYIRALDMI